jgi:hypothetical protein
MKKSKTIASTIVAGAFALHGTLSNAQSGPSVKLVSDETIRPFKVRVPDAELMGLRQRILTTRWPDQETVADQSQGAKLSKLQGMVHYWGTGYDWRKAEAKLNALLQFITTIDSVDIHFIIPSLPGYGFSGKPTATGWPGNMGPARLSQPGLLPRGG